MWKISKELYEELKQHCERLARSDGEPDQRLEEELSFLLCKLEDEGRIKN